MDKSQKALGWAARDDSGILSPSPSPEEPTATATSPSRFSSAASATPTSTSPRTTMASPTTLSSQATRSSARSPKPDPTSTSSSPGTRPASDASSAAAAPARTATKASRLESYCPTVVLTYNSPDLDGTTTYGGYSDILVVNERYAVRIPDGLSLAGAAPLLCAGITVYSPLRYYRLDRPGMHIGVVGLGGLGHVAVKFAKALGMKVTVISTSPGKKAEAVEKMGADAFVISRDEEQVKAAAGSMDGIIDTVSAAHPVATLVGMLKAHGKLVVLGASTKALEVPTIPLLIGRRMVGGSNTGGMKETQEMIDFAAEHRITADVEVVPMEYVNTALERLERGDVKYRFVIDVANSLKSI